MKDDFVYKVVLPVDVTTKLHISPVNVVYSANTFSSWGATGKARVLYTIGMVARAPKFLSDRGFYLFAYEKPRNLFHSWSRIEENIVVLKCLPGERVPLPHKICYEQQLARGVVKPQQFFWVPKNMPMRYMYKTLEPVEIVYLPDKIRDRMLGVPKCAKSMLWFTTMCDFGF